MLRVVGDTLSLDDPNNPMVIRISVRFALLERDDLGVLTSVDALSILVTSFGDGIIQDYRDNYMVASERSTRRYRRRFLTLGHVRPFRRNGGQQRQVLNGIDLLQMTLYRVTFPTATAAEIIAYMWNVHSRFCNPPRFYHNSQITRAEQRIGFTRKRNSTTARQAFLRLDSMLHLLDCQLPFWHS